MLQQKEYTQGPYTFLAQKFKQDSSIFKESCVDI